MGAVNSFKFKLTGPQIGKYCVAYERVINEQGSFEIESTYFSRNSPLDEGSQFFFPNIALRREGFEIKFLINKLKRTLVSNKNQIYKSIGVGISYRYQHIKKTKFWEGGFSGSSDYSYAYLAQTKNLIGVFAKASRFKLYKRLCLEHFLGLGCYFGTARTALFEIIGPGKNNPDFLEKNIYQPNGFTTIPVFNFGINIRFNFINNK